MKIQKKQGYVLYTPLTASFQMLEIGGSRKQRVNSLTQEFVPDRYVTPFQLKPQLSIQDPDNVISSGDKSTDLVNVKWTVERYNSGTLQDSATPTTSDDGSTLDYGDYTISTLDHSLIYKANLETTEIVKISFSADFIDTRRAETLHYDWSIELTSIDETPTNISVEILDVPSKYNLSPFKDRGTFEVACKVRNGSDYLEESQISAIEWQRYDDDDSSWVAIGKDDTLGLESDPDTMSVLTVKQSYIQKERIRAVASVTTEVGTLKHYSPVKLLRRYYGMYEEDLDILAGKYINEQTTRADVELKVENRQGIISSPEKYFDLGIYYPWDSGKFRLVSHTSTATLTREQLNTERHTFGITVREKSAFLPLAMPDGTLLAHDDSLLCAQVPLVSVEEED